MLNSHQSVRALFENMGMSKDEARFYLATVELGPATIQQVGKRARIHRVVSYNIMRSLLEKGLIELEPKRYGKRITAITPRRLIGLAVEEQERFRKIAENLEEAMPEILAHYHTGAQPRVRYLEGIDGFRELMHEIEEIGKPYDHIGGSETPLVKIVGREKVEASIRRKDELGIKRRVIATREPWTEEQVRKAPKGLRDYRFLPEGTEIPTRCYIYGGNRVAFASFGSDILIVVIEDDGIFKLQKLFFEALWEKCGKE